MTLKAGFEHFLNSDKFRDVAKKKDLKGGRYRLWKSRFKEGKLSEQTIITQLKKAGYTVTKNIVVEEPKSSPNTKRNAKA